MSAMEEHSRRGVKDLKDVIPGLVHLAELSRGRLYLATVKPGLVNPLKTKSDSMITYF
ncbi:unnamed protein product, partial [Oppiella nova]